MPAITGHIASFAPICIAVAASRPGATNSTYESPPSCAWSSSISWPRSTPTESRKKTGFRNAVVIVARHVRR
jgi:hypothetical protein